MQDYPCSLKDTGVPASPGLGNTTLNTEMEPRRSGTRETPTPTESHHWGTRRRAVRKGATAVIGRRAATRAERSDVTKDTRTAWTLSAPRRTVNQYAFTGTKPRRPQNVSGHFEERDSRPKPSLLTRGAPAHLHLQTAGGSSHKTAERILHKHGVGRGVGRPGTLPASEPTCRWDGTHARPTLRTAVCPRAHRVSREAQESSGRPSGLPRVCHHCSVTVQ